VIHEKAKPVEKQGRKAPGLSPNTCKMAELPKDNNSSGMLGFLWSILNKAQDILGTAYRA